MHFSGNICIVVSGAKWFVFAANGCWLVTLDPQRCVMCIGVSSAALRGRAAGSPRLFLFLSLTRAAENGRKTRSRCVSVGEGERVPLSPCKRPRDDGGNKVAEGKK